MYRVGALTIARACVRSPLYRISRRRMETESAVPNITYVATHPSELVIDSVPSVYTWMLECVHAYSGLPWWAVVPMLAFATRAALMPLMTVHRERREALLGSLQPELTLAAKNALQSLQERRGVMVTLKAWLRERRQVLKKCPAGHLSRNFYIYSYFGVVIAQVMGLRYGLEIDPSFAAEGALWFPSLAAHDPWLRLNWILAFTSIGTLLPVPATPQGKVVFGLLSGGFFLTLPWSHFFGMPEAVVLHFLGVTAFRYVDKYWVQKMLARNSGPGIASGTTTKNPRW